MGRPIHYWTETEIVELLRINRMPSLKRYEAMTHFATAAAALAFLSALPAQGLEVVSSLHVKINDQLGFDPNLNRLTAPFLAEVPLQHLW